MGTAQGSIARFIRTRVIPQLIPMLFRLPGARHFLFRTVSQTGIQYHHSPLSVGMTGSVRGGDRLPWVKTKSLEDNFTPLASIDWQVHVYGELRHRLADACAALGLPLYVFEWMPQMSQSGLVRSALYLVRPDGYVAIADPECDTNQLSQYFTSRGLATARRHSGTSAEALNQIWK